MAGNVEQLISDVLTSRRATTIWLARHGRSPQPRPGAVRGRLPRMRCRRRPSPGALADFLGTRHLAAIYSSPMLRARRTAGIVLASHPRLHRLRIDSDLHEVNTGWQGQPLEALERINFDFYARPIGSDDESLQMIRDRMVLAESACCATPGRKCWRQPWRPDPDPRWHHGRFASPIQRPSFRDPIATGVL